VGLLRPGRLYGRWVITLALLGSAAVAGTGDGQPNPGPDKEPLPHLADVIAHTVIPDQIPVLPARELDGSCGPEGLAQVVSVIDADRLSDRSGTIVLVVKADACHWLGTPAGQELATHYQARARDPVGLATAARAFGGITRGDYQSFARPYLASLMPAGAALSPATAALAVDVAAGYCAPVLDRACFSQALHDLLPAEWRLEDAAAIAFGDLFGSPLPAMTDGALMATIAFIERSALPIRSDALTQVPEPPRSRLEELRGQYYRYSYGTSERL